MGMVDLGEIGGKVGLFRGCSKLDLLAWLKIEQVVLKLTQFMFSMLKNEESDLGCRDLSLERGLVNRERKGRDE